MNNNIEQPRPKRRRIPYAITNYRNIRRDNMYYVDKTRYIERIEDANSYFFFIRPRRFGKTLLLEMLSYYYDIYYRDEFEMLFGGLYIGNHPTPNHNKYLVIKLNFSVIDGTLGDYKGSLDSHCRIEFELFCDTYADLLPAGFKQEMQNEVGAVAQLDFIYKRCAKAGLPIYLFIDEYDHFTNDILSDDTKLLQYEDETHGEGYLRKFFNTIKAGSSSSIERIFVTGVSPVTMDDLTSGFNIGTNYTTDPDFNGTVGFDEEEVRTMFDYYLSCDDFPDTTDDLIQKMKLWYDSYCFAFECLGKPTMFNSDMTLYFLDNYVRHKCPPRDMLDANMRSDYNKLRMLMRKDQGFGANSSTVQTIVEHGEITADVVSHFPARNIILHENFVSLMYYFGMLTYGGLDSRGRAVLTIPNQCVREQTFGYMMNLYEREGLSVGDRQKGELLADMAFDGLWRPYFDFIADCLKRYSSQRDKVLGESYVHGFTMGQTCLCKYYLPLSEEDQGAKADGYSDLYFMPRKEQYPYLRFAYIIEFKYLPGKATDAEVEAKVRQAIAQANRYAASEKVQTSLQGCELIKLYVVYRGMEMAAIDRIL